MDFHVTDPHDEVSVEFSVSTKKTLNSNRMPNVTFVKSKLARDLRRMGAEIGVAHHATPELSQRFFNVTSLEHEVVKRRATIKKSMNKAKASPEEIEQELLKVYDDVMGTAESKDDIGLNFMLHRFSTSVQVFSPTKKIFDPPNFYPTIKPFIDGMTDAGWWIDDNYNYMTEMSFSFGGVRRNSNNEYGFILSFKPTILTNDDKDKVSMGESN